jgi:hypothetical protein
MRLQLKRASRAESDGSKSASGGQRETFEKVSLWYLFKMFQWSSRRARRRAPLRDVLCKIVYEYDYP